MQCPECGRPILDAALAACPSCGFPLTASPAAPNADLPAAGAAPVEVARTEAPTSGPEAANSGGAASATSAASPDTPTPAVPAAPVSTQSAPNPPPAPAAGPAGYPHGYPPAAYPPGYMPYPPGYAPPSMPLAGQPGPQTMPPGYMPYPYPFAAPPTTPQPAASASPNRALLIVTLAVLAAILLIFAGSAVAFVALRTYIPAGGGNIATPTVRPAATPTLTGTDTIIFRDPMTSNQYGWADDGTHCFFRPDGYHDKGYICYAPVAKLTNLDVSVQTKQVAGETDRTYGIVFRRVSAGNFYAFSINSNGDWTAIRVVDDLESELVPYAPNVAIQRGLNATNTLEVRAAGSHFEFYVNSTNVGQVDDTTYSAGYIGVAGSINGEVVFTDMTVGILS